MQSVYAYSRVMAGDEESQNRLNLIRDMQVSEDNIFLDYPTKEKRSRIEYNKMIKLLKENDLLYVGNFASLGDGYKEVEEQWRFLTKTKKVDIVLIDMPDIDTRKGKSGYGPLVADTVLRMLEYMKDTENSVRKMRQKEGIALAKERGITFGRHEKAVPEFNKAYNMWKNKKISAKEAAEMCGMHSATFYRRAKKMQE